MKSEEGEKAAATVLTKEILIIQSWNQPSVLRDKDYYVKNGWILFWNDMIYELVVVAN